jgi:hypothetical protein
MNSEINDYINILFSKKLFEIKDLLKLLYNI